MESYSNNAKMMLGYIDDDDDEILDYDGNLDLSTDNEDEDEAESVQDYVQPYPETPEEKIHWQEQIRMIHLRSHLNQLLEKVKHAHYVTDKTREELKKCREQIQHYESERNSLFREIQSKESDGNQSAVHRVRAAHERVCKELEDEQKLERRILDRLDQAEYDLAVAEVERGKFILAEDDLLQREHQLSKEKTDMAMVRLHKEELLARQALITRRKDERTHRNVVVDAERRHYMAVEEAEKSHERANKYLQKTLTKLQDRQKEEAERYKTDMTNKMDMLLKLRNDIASNRENLRAIRARDKAAERKEKSAEEEERQRISAKGGNPEEILLVKKRRNEAERQKQLFEADQKIKKSNIMNKILMEEENIRKRKKQQPQLWDNPEREKTLRVSVPPQKPLQTLENYMRASGDGVTEIQATAVENKEKEILRTTKKKSKERLLKKRNACETESACEEGEEMEDYESYDSFSVDEDYPSVLGKLSQELRALYGSKEDLTSLVPSNANILMSDKGFGKKTTNKNKNQTVEESESNQDGIGNKETDAQDNSDNIESNPLYGSKERLDRAEEENEQAEGDGFVDGEDGPMAEISFPSIGQDSDSGPETDQEENVVDLAAPEFEGLWNRETKPYRVPKDNDVMANKPIGGSKMDKEILQKTLEKTRENIVVTQVAAGREFTGCPFYSKPDVIHFKDFVVGKSYKKRVTLTNVSYTVNYIKFLDITERLKDFIKIHFDPPGQMSAGLTCEMTVTFKPMINEDLKGEVSFLTQTGPFNIPLVCSTKKCDLVLDTGCVEFGTTVIGETLKRTFTLTNRGALGTKFDFFKVTGVKPRTLTTAGTSLGRMEQYESQDSKFQVDAKKTVGHSQIELEPTRQSVHEEKTAGQGNHDKNSFTNIRTTDSMRTVSPDSTGVPDKTKQTGGSSLAVESKKKSEEALDKIPEAAESSAPIEPVPEGSDDVEGTAGEAAPEGSEQKQDMESDEATSPDLAVSEMEDYGSLDGMRVGPLVTGEIGPFSSLRLEIIWQPTIPAKVDSEFLVTFTDPSSEPLSIHALANAIDVPVWVERQTVDLKICMFDRLYQDTITVNNRATTALRLKFEVCKELRNHLELLPRTGYIQAQSQFSAQLKFLPRQSLFEEAAKYFDKETGVLEAPMTIRVADQTTPVNFTLQAVLTNSDLEFDVSDIDFGHCTIHESVKKTIKLTNNSILPHQFGFVGLPEYIEVQPNDGFGTLLPLETLELDVIFSPRKTRDYKLELVCRSLINRDFKIQVSGVGVLTPLELSHQVIHFGATPLYDVRSVAFHVINSHTSSNEFTHPVPRIGKGEICPVGPTSFEFMVPNSVPITISPRVATVMPGEKCRVQVRFAPTLNDYDVRQEALRIHTKQEAIREQKEREEAALREKQERENKDKALTEAMNKQKKANKNKNNPIPTPKKGNKNKNNEKALNKQKKGNKNRKNSTQSELHSEENVRASSESTNSNKNNLAENGDENDKNVCDSNENVNSNRKKQIKIDTLKGNKSSQSFNGFEALNEDSRLSQDKSETNIDTWKKLEGTMRKKRTENKKIISRRKTDDLRTSFDANRYPRGVDGYFCSSSKGGQVTSVTDKNKTLNSDGAKGELMSSRCSSSSYYEVCLSEDPGSVDVNYNKGESNGEEVPDDEKELQDNKEEGLPDDENGYDHTEEAEDEDKDTKGKGKGKEASKGGAPQAKASKQSAAPSSTGSPTQESSPRFDPDTLSRDAPEYQAAVTALVRQFRGQFQSFTIPCCVALGETGNPGELNYSTHNTLFLDVHCPAIKPPIVVISDGGKRTVDFGDVSIGQTCPRSITIQNISDKNVELRATTLNPHGPFLVLNALRALSPGATHTVLLTFAPAQGQIFQEGLGIITLSSTLHLTMRGRGVSPMVNLSVEDGVFDMSAVLVSEYVERPFKIQNTSTLAIDYVIKQDSLSPLRHEKQQVIPMFVTNPQTPNTYVGTQNDNGKNVFDIIPTTGTIQAGETKEITVTFAPDHDSDLYSDGVRIELFDQRCLPRGQEESHFFQVKGQAKPRTMFLDGVDLLAPGLESLAHQVLQIDDEDPACTKDISTPAPNSPKKNPAQGKAGIVTSPSALMTINSVMSNDTFQPAVREVYAGCVRTMAVSQKKPGKTNGEFSVEGIQGLLQKGFTVEPQKGMVEAGTKKAIVFTWTPPQGFDPSNTIEETVILNLKCDVTEQIPLMIRGMVISE